jgi:DinB superfamily
MSEPARHSNPSHLSILAYQVRGCTLKLFDATDPDALTWTPPGTSNHILWHAGHVVWVADVLTIEPVTGSSELPPGWAERFGQNSQPVMVSDWPRGAEVRSRLESQLERVLNLLDEHRAKIADADQTPLEGGWPLLDGIIHGWHDEARHQGEVYLLQKLWMRLQKQ